MTKHLLRVCLSTSNRRVWHRRAEDGRGDSVMEPKISLGGRSWAPILIAEIFVRGADAFKEAPEDASSPVKGLTMPSGSFLLRVGTMGRHSCRREGRRARWSQLAALCLVGDEW
jgi:hypothetical protein